MADLRAHSSTSNVFRVCLKNSSTGQPLTGLDHTSSGLIISTICDNEATATAYTVAGSNVETITTLGTFAAPTSGKCRFKAVDGTNHPGLYEFQFADARFSVANAKRFVFSVSGATNLLAMDYEVELTRMNLQDGTRGGMLAMPNAVAGASGGLWILGSMTGSPAITGSFSILNTSGNAMSLISAGSNGSGLSLTGNGTAAGITSEGGATGAGAVLKGGGTSGHGLRLFAQAGNSYGALIEGAGSGAAHGVSIAAAGTGVDISLTDPLPANVTQWNTVAIATPDTAGYPKVTIKSGTGTGEVSMTSGVVNANMAQVSGDSAAADALETMLDGTGGNALSLGKLNIIDTSGSGNAVSILCSGGGSAVAMQSGANGTTGVFDVLCTGSGAAVHIYGGGYGMRIDTLGDGLWIDTVAGKACIRLLPPGTGAAIDFEQGVGFTGPMIQGNIDFENYLVSALNAGSLASDTITAAKIATDAITSAKVATSAVDEIVDAVFDEARSGHTTAGTFGELVTQHARQFVHAGTAQAGASTTITLASGASATNDLYNGLTVQIYSGTGAGQSRRISDYVGSTKVATVLEAWGTTPDNTSAYQIVGTPAGDTSVAGGLTAGQAAQLTAIETATALITAGGVTVSSPVSADGQLLTLVRGDTYNVTSGQPITFTAAAGVWPDLTGAAAKTFTIRNAAGTSVLAVTPTITAVGAGTQSVRVDLTSAETAVLVPGDPPGEQDHTFDLQVTLSDASTKVTLVLGAVVVLADVTTA